MVPNSHVHVHPYKVEAYGGELRCKLRHYTLHFTSYLIGWETSFVMSRESFRPVNVSLKDLPRARAPLA